MLERMQRAGCGPPHPAHLSSGAFPIRTSMKLGLSVLALSFLVVPSAFALPPGFAFLEIPTGARASAMGGAYSTLSKGAEAAFWNPAGLEAVKDVQIMGGHYELFSKLRHDHFVAAWRMFGLGASGSVRALYSEPIEERDELGNLIGTFGSH